MHQSITKTLFTIWLLGTLSTASYAQSSGGGSSGSSTFKRFFASLALKGGLAKVSSEDAEVVEDRGVWSFGGEVTLGVRALGLMFGASADYLVLKQRQDPEDVDGTNASGRVLTIAPTVGLPFGRFLLQLRPQFYSTYKLDRSEGGDAVEYSAPELPSVTGQLIYSLGKSFIGVEYGRITYKKRSSGSTDVDLEDDAKVTIANVGLVYGYKF